MSGASGSRARTPVALTIAGSDSGGGAGIQADLKAFARCGVHGTSAITAITAQNTLGVDEIHPVPPATIVAQVRAILSDIRVDAVKVGMLGAAQSAEAVAQALGELPDGIPVVVDPVMVAESGARLLDAGAERVLVERVLPLASVLTPNLPEARALLGARAPAAFLANANANADADADSDAGADADAGFGPDYCSEEQREVAEAEALARALLELGPRAVVVTGGHRARAVDLFLAAGERERSVEIAGERHRDGAAHGSGCTHSSLLAAQLALGRTPLQAARVARELIGDAVRDGLRDVGAGAGPVDVIGLARVRADADAASADRRDARRG
jgi:hydroxymethylpyrimidine/phosphomethylpyrimidine kinase